MPLIVRRVSASCRSNERVCTLYDEQLYEMCRYSSECAPGDSIEEHVARMYGDDVLRMSEQVAVGIREIVRESGWASVDLFW